MGKNKQTADTDIAEQRYRGASPTVAALGEGAIQAKFLTISGFLAGGIAAFIFPSQAKKIVEPLQKAVDKAVLSENGLVKILGDFGKFTIDIGKHTADWVTSRKFLQSSLGKLNKEKFAVGLDGAIITSAAASVVGIFTGGATGVNRARAGKKQFETAKDEIITLRETNEKLRTKLIDTELALDDLKTASDAKHGKLHVTPDDHARTTPSAHISTDGATSSRVADLTSDIALG